MDETFYTPSTPEFKLEREKGPFCTRCNDIMFDSDRREYCTCVEWKKALYYADPLRKFRLTEWLKDVETPSGRVPFAWITKETIPIIEGSGLFLNALLSVGRPSFCRLDVSNLNSISFGKDPDFQNLHAVTAPVVVLWCGDPVQRRRDIDSDIIIEFLSIREGNGLPVWTILHPSYTKVGEYMLQQEFKIVHLPPRTTS